MIEFGEYKEIDLIETLRLVVDIADTDGRYTYKEGEYEAVCEYIKYLNDNAHREVEISKAINDIDVDVLAMNKKISRNTPFKDECTEKKLNVINWSIELSGKTTQGDYDTHWVWESDDKRYRVGLKKYGKEYYMDTIKRKDGSKGNNKNDMRPVIEIDGNIIDIDGSFKTVYKFFRHIQKTCGNDVLDIVGCLMIRNAFMEDHVKINGKYQYQPDKSIIIFLADIVPEYNGIRADAYIHYIDAIAQNEDTKYHTLGYDVSQKYGRYNNVTTYAHIIASLLDRTDIIDMCAAYSRPPAGVAPMSYGEIAKAFPLLNVE